MLAAPDSFEHIARFRSVEYGFALRFKVGSFNGVMRGIAIRAHLGVLTREWSTVLFAAHVVHYPQWPAFPPWLAVYFTFALISLISII